LRPGQYITDQKNQGNERGLRRKESCDKQLLLQVHGNAYVYGTGREEGCETGRGSRMVKVEGVTYEAGRSLEEVSL
jgi:hypothetical protein